MRPIVNKTLSFNRNPQNIQSSPPPSRTKLALAFLCLFDGLRTPSIRRLVRKPRTIAMKPLLTFDPSFYAPSSKNALQNIYLKTINCPCEIAVDPSVQIVLNLLRKHATSVSSQRVILHYYGHGCHPPLADGCLFFFTDDRAKYKPIKIQNIVNACTCPLCIILDCPFAGILLQHINIRPNIFAFLASSSSEPLPLSTDVPMDIFSSCLLSPFETALFWRNRQSTTINGECTEPPEESRTFLNQLFMSILDSIVFDTQSRSTVEAYARDPSINQLMRGFVLAQRVMLSFNLHPIALPELKPMAQHQLWEFWEVALDFSITLSLEEGMKMIFELFVSSFKKFPNNGYIPLFSFFVQIPQFNKEAFTVLLDYLDSVEASNDLTSRSSLLKTIISLPKPSPESMIVLAKILASSTSQAIDRTTPLTFASSSNPDVMKFGMLSMICAMNNQNLPSVNALAQICMDHSRDCMPYSAIFLGLLIYRSSGFINVSPIRSSFLPIIKKGPYNLLKPDHQIIACDQSLDNLCAIETESSSEVFTNSSEPILTEIENTEPFKEPTEDDVVSLLFLFGSTRDIQYFDVVESKLNDKSPLIRMQAFYALLNILTITPDPKAIETMNNYIRNENDVRLKRCINDAKPVFDFIDSFDEEGKTTKPLIRDWDKLNPCLQLLVNSVRSTGFLERIAENNIFYLSQTKNE